MSLSDILMEYINTFEKGQGNSELENKFIASINDTHDLDELEEAKTYIMNYLKEKPVSYEKNLQEIREIAKFAAKGMVIGAGVGFFMNSTYGGALLGSMGALEVSGLTSLYRNARTRQNLRKIEQIIDDQLNQQRLPINNI